MKNICIVIRGPAGVGKSTVATLLAAKLNAQYFSYDEVMEIHRLDAVEGDGIPAANFIKANEYIIPKAKQHLEQGTSVILDGCFYRQKQIADVKALLPQARFFTLRAPLVDCLLRNENRGSPVNPDAISAVHKLVNRNEGKVLHTKGKTAEEITNEIIRLL